ncbi:MAG: hypothetical protein P4M11_13035 [Candidatus Pacebacteria bacterium]|nr:hypothetical protein [Candidatus Paceibacterota bacterium]
MDWTIFERKGDAKAFRGLVAPDEELRSLVKTQYTICEIDDLTYYQLSEKEPDGCRATKTKLQANSIKVHFPDSRFHFGSTIAKFDYYIRFLIKYSKRRYYKMLKDWFGIVTELYQPRLTGRRPGDGFELEVSAQDVYLVAEEDVVAVLDSQFHTVA